MPNPARCLALVCVFLVPLAVAAEQSARPVHTYSIVARDAATGQLGVAVQSHWFSVGSVVPWAEPGMGAVATQALTDPDYGPLGLRLMRGGKTAGQALAALLAADEHPEVRQVGMVDAEGRVANYTGAKAIAEHCEIAGSGYTAQANLMWKPAVCEAMAAAYEASRGDLAERLMAALEAAEAVGGDIRGMQSAALLVVSGDPSLPPWGGRIFNLRVEDDAEPLVELRRLLTLNRAYNLMDKGDERVAAGEIDRAAEAYGAAQALAPDNHEMVFWEAVSLANAGQVETSLPLFARAFSMWPKWREVVLRLRASGLLPDDTAVLEAILAAGSGGANPDHREGLRDRAEAGHGG